MEKFNVIIIGAGPAGLSASVYASRAGAQVLIIEKMSAGGKINLTDSIENYMGFEEISGIELATKMRKQAKNNKVEFMYDRVLDVDIAEKLVITENNGNIQYDSLIIAAGTLNKQTGIKNEERLLGAGVSYCATCDGMFFKGKDVAVLGGGYGAIKDALYLKNICNKVYLINRKEEFVAKTELINEIKESENVEILTSSILTDIKGDTKLTSIDITTSSGETKNIEIAGLFVAIGITPDTSYLTNKIALDEGGYIITNERMETNVEYVYAAGDIRNTPLRQIVTACADGAIAGEEAVRHVKKIK